MLPARSGNARPSPWPAVSLVVLALSCGADPAAAGSPDAWGDDPVEDERCRGEFSYDACGGALDGSWTVDHVCGASRIHADQLYGGSFSLDCWIVADLVHEASGTVTYADREERADLRIRTLSRYTLPDACAASLEPALPPAAVCRRFAERVREAGSHGDCAYGGGGCACEFRRATTLRSTRSYREGPAGIADFLAEGHDGFSYCARETGLVEGRADMFLYLRR